MIRAYIFMAEIVWWRISQMRRAFRGRPRAKLDHPLTEYTKRTTSVYSKREI
jgi:hypothetical protein